MNDVTSGLTLPPAETMVLEVLTSLRTWVEFGDDRVTVAGLIRLAEAFGYSGPSVRIALTRLCSRGALRRDGRGTYGLGPKSKARSTDLAAWRGALKRVEPDWDGSWLALLAVKARAPSNNARRAMELRGFRQFRTGLWIRPANLQNGLETLRSDVRVLGLNRSWHVLRLKDLEQDLVARAESLWDRVALEASYVALTERLRHLQDAMVTMPEDDAVRLSYMLGRYATGAAATDPLLPASMVSNAARQTFFQTLEGLHRGAWALWSDRLNV